MRAERDTLLERDIPTIMQLGGVFMNPTGEVIYAGWDNEGLPRATKVQDNLSPLAQDALLTTLTQTVTPQEIGNRSLIPLEVNDSITVIDSRGSGGEHMLLVSGRSTNGEQSSTIVKEVDVLESLTTAGMHFCQNTERRPIFNLSVPSINPRQPDVAILLKPESFRTDNKEKLEVFVRNVLSQLILKDSQLPRDQRRGYLNALSPESGSADSNFLKATLNMIYRDVDDELVQDVRGRLESLIFTDANPEPLGQRISEGLGKLIFMDEESETEDNRGFFEKMIFERERDEEPETRRTQIRQPTIPTVSFTGQLEEFDLRELIVLAQMMHRQASEIFR